VDYTHSSTSEYIKYKKEIRVYFNIAIDAGEGIQCNLLDLGIIITLERDSIECYLDFDKLVITISNKGKHNLLDQIEDNHYKNIKILPQEIPVSSEIPQIYLCNTSYSNKCYDIFYGTEKGVTLISKKLYNKRIMDTKLEIIWGSDEELLNFRIWSHKNYLFMLTVLKYHRDKVYLTVIDSKSGSLYTFMGKDDFKKVLR